MPNMRFFNLCCLTGLVVCFSLTARGATTVMNLGPLFSTQDNGFAIAQAVSDDGRVVVGVATKERDSNQANQQDLYYAFVWTPSQGMRNLGYFSGGGSLASAQGVSANGRVVVGSSDGIDNAGKYFKAHALHWSQQTGLSDLGTLPDGSNSLAMSLSADGSVIVGHSSNAQQKDRATLWRLGERPVDLGTLGGDESIANHVSRDGLTVVGHAQIANGHVHAFIWNATDGMRDLGQLAELEYSSATAVSGNGQVVVGIGSNINTSISPSQPVTKAFIWHKRSGKMEEIANPFHGESIAPTGISADGLTVIGVLNDANDVMQAFRWRRETGVLIDTPTRPELRMDYARGISANGRYVVGRLDPSKQAYRAEFD